MATWATRDRAEAAEARVAELEAEVQALRAEVSRLRSPMIDWDADYAAPDGRDARARAKAAMTVARSR